MDRSVANLKMRELYSAAIIELGSSDESERPCNECDLPRDLALGQPSHLALPDHVHHLDALNCTVIVGNEFGPELTTKKVRAAARKLESRFGARRVTCAA